MHANDRLTLEEWSKLKISDSNFDAGYFDEGASCGFPVPYTWENMRIHIEKKLDFIEKIYRRINWNSILFCGCSKGFEVREARKRGYDAWGIDISQYAVDNVDPKAKGFVRIGDISDISYPDNSFDLVCAFDVLHILPSGTIAEEGRREKAYREIQRVAKKGVVIRTTAKWRGGETGYYQDGNPLTLWPVKEIIFQLEKHDKMDFFFTMLSNRFEISWFFFCKKGDSLAWDEYYV